MESFEWREFREFVRRHARSDQGAAFRARRELLPAGYGFADMLEFFGGVRHHAI